MNDKYSRPIFTEKSECQDCYKCIRQCPVKAIKVSDGHADIMADRCIACGHCLSICPIQAKKVRNELPKIKHLLRTKPVYASLAPSIVSEFPEYSERDIAGLLKTAGFAGVAETAVGADIVSHQMLQLLPEWDKPLLISSACPVIVQYINTYYPQYSQYIAPLLSPMLSHGQLLHREFGHGVDKGDIAVVFFGPCPAKKIEADQFPHYIDVSATFSDLRQLIQDIPLDTNSAGHEFCQQKAASGVLYPMNGGMLKSMQNMQGLPGMQSSSGIHDKVLGSEFRSCEYSGLEDIDDLLQGLIEVEPEEKIVLELMACRGGCINGPLTRSTRGKLSRKDSIERRGQERPLPVDVPDIPIHHIWDATPLPAQKVPESEIQAILRSIGKESSQDEKNCGACGYNSCRDFAVACQGGRAEPGMCISYLKKISESKANALIRTMPSGLVIVDEHLDIIECNKHFAALVGEEADLVYMARPGMKGASLQKLIPFTSLFADVRESGVEISDRTVHHNQKIFQVSIFPIERHRVTGGIIQDVTVPWVQRDNIIRKATQVLEKNVSTVQQIAYLLGENAAQSESMLNSIISSFQEQNRQDADGF